MKGRSPLIVDDMISTGATMISAMAELLNRGCSPHVTLAASHGLFVKDALERFSSFPVDGIWVTDSVMPAKRDSLIPRHVVGIKDLIAEVIMRLHGRS